MVVGIVIVLILAALIALIVFNWTIFPLVLWLAIVLTVVEAVLALVDLLFIVYYFNLDMKLTTKLYPLFQKHYDTIKRNKQI